MKLDIEASIEQMSQALIAYCHEKKLDNPVVVGIHSGGVWLAEHLINRINTDIPLATLDITFYRDDITRAGLHPKVKQTSLPSVENKHIILVDDVLMSGRTIRAAMNEIFDYGRPASISLAILYDLDQGELPIKADVVGQVLKLNPDQRVKLSGPNPIKVSVIET